MENKRSLGEELIAAIEDAIVGQELGEIVRPIMPSADEKSPADNTDPSMLG